MSAVNAIESLSGHSWRQSLSTKGETDAGLAVLKHSQASILLMGLEDSTVSENERK